MEITDHLLPIPREFISQILNSTVDNITDILVLVEPSEPYRILWINEAHRKYLEYPETCIIGQPLVSFLIPPEAQRIQALIRHVIDTCEPIYIDELEVRGFFSVEEYELPENATYWSVKVFPIKDRQGKVSAVYGIATDITATKVNIYARDLARERKRLEAILNAVPSGIMVIEGKERTVTHLNRRAFDLFGRAVQPEKPLPKAWQLKLYKLDGTLLPLEQLPASIAVKYGELVHDVEVILERPDGKRVIVHANAAPLCDEQGRTYGAVGTFEDITALKEVEQNLARERARLLTVLETVPVGIVVAEPPDVTVTFDNATMEKMFGYRPPKFVPLEERLQPIRILNAHGRQYATEEFPISRALLLGETVVNEEMVVERPDGKLASLLTTASPISEGGRVTGAVASYMDITPLREAQKQLQQAYIKEHYISETLQKAMLPTIPERLGGITAACEYHPAYEEAHVGGDFFDLFIPSPGLIGIVIGDVSGKGVEAAVRTAQAKYTLRAFASENPEPALVIERLNNVIAEGGDLEGFITLFYGVLNTQEDALCYVNAGHEPPLCLSCSDCTVKELMTSGTALGIIPDITYTQHTIPVKCGDRLLLYTDGVTDARNSRGFLDIKGLKNFFLSARLEPPKVFNNRLMHHLWEWSGGHLKDDVAILMVNLE